MNLRRRGCFMAHELEALFNPSSVAIIGASPDEKKIGGRPLSYLQRYGFKGEIYPINPKYESINQLKAYATIQEVPNAVDVAIIAVPQRAVIEQLTNCGKQGVKAAIIFSAGFGELGEEGQQLQQKLKEIALTYNMRLLGPNCLGMFNVQQGFYGTFSTIIEEEKPYESSIGFVSQSGAFGSHVFTLARQRNIGFSYFVATGNEADIDVADCIEYLALDDKTSVIACYIEGVQNGEKLLRAFELARQNNKPVIALKVGRTEVGMKAAMSHTGSIVGSDKVFDTVLKQHGVYRAQTIDEFLDVTYLASTLPVAQGNRTAVFTISGGVGILLADQLAEYGFQLPETPNDVKRKLEAILPIAGTQNPIDTTAQISYIPNLLEDFMDEVLGSGQYDSAIIFLGFAGLKHESIEQRVVTLQKMKERYAHIPQIPVTITDERSNRIFHNANVPVISDPSRAVIALHALKEFALFNTKQLQTMHELPAVDIQKLPSSLTEYQSKNFLQQFDLPVTAERLVTSEEALRKELEQFTWPIVMKGMSPQILHKTEKGLVALNVSSLSEAQTIYNQFKAIIEQQSGAEFEGVLLQEMITGDYQELFVGAKKDPIFGQMVVVGLGGIYIEVLKDIAMRKAPISVDESLEMLEELNAFKILEGYRGSAASDVVALSEMISKFSAILAQYPEDILEADLNPIMVFEKGNGIKIADALLTLNKKTVTI